GRWGGPCDSSRTPFPPPTAPTSRPRLWERRPLWEATSPDARALLYPPSVLPVTPRATAFEPRAERLRSETAQLRLRSHYLWRCLWRCLWRRSFRRGLHW